MLNVEKKPEAPWVVREHDSIKFTDKIETYSRLELEDSECSSTSSYQLHEIDNSHLGLVPKPTCEQLSATHKSRSRPTNRKRR